MSQAFIFLGKPGSGKGTQAQILHNKHGFFHLCSSKIFEDRKKSDLEFKNRVQELSQVKNNGGLLPDEFVWTPISDAILLVPEGESIVFDGCTRTAEQMRLLLKLLERLNFEVFIFLLDVPSDMCDNRMVDRAKNSPEEERRIDDVNEQARQRRLREFEDHFPSIEFFLSTVGRIMFVIDAGQSEQDVLIEIENFGGLPSSVCVSI